MIRRIAVVAAALLVAAGCGSNSAEPSGDNATIRVAHVPSPLFAPLYVAQAKGYFKDAGIDVELEAVKSGQDAIPLAASGKLDVIVAGFSAGMFSALNSGLEFDVVGSMGVSSGDPDDSPTALEVSKTASGVDDIAGLKGKKIAVGGGAGSAGGYLLDSVLRRQGLSLKDVKPVNLSNPDMEAALKGGSVDAALTSAPFSTSIEENNVGTPLGVPAKGTFATGVIFGGDFTKSPRAQKFFDALVKASLDLQEDPSENDEIVDIVAKATQQDTAVLKSSPPYTWNQNLAPTASQLEAMQTSWLDADLLPYAKAIKSSSYLDDSFSKAARDGS